MRAVLLSIVLSFTACAHTAPGKGPINVHAVRVEIAGVIEAQSDPRAIISMGKVTREVAVVYTESPAGERHEETWSKSPAGWTLQGSRSVASR